MRIGFHRRARKELYRAVDWYDARKSGLGDDFYAAVETAFTVMRTFTDAQLLVGTRVRKAVLGT